MPYTTEAATLCANPDCTRTKRHPGLCTDEIATRTGLTIEQVQTVLDFEAATPAMTPARDALCAFYAANPDVENAVGDVFLALPEALRDQLDELLLEAAREKAINEHVANCVSCREFGICGTFLSDGTVECTRDSEDGWDGVRYDNVEV